MRQAPAMERHHDDEGRLTGQDGRHRPAALQQSPGFCVRRCPVPVLRPPTGAERNDRYDECEKFLVTVSH